VTFDTGGLDIKPESAMLIMNQRSRRRGEPRETA